jgi:hypothetical protein
MRDSGDRVDKMKKTAKPSQKRFWPKLEVKKMSKRKKRKLRRKLFFSFFYSFHSFICLLLLTRKKGLALVRECEE